MKNLSNPKEWLGSLLSYFMSIKTIDDNIESLRISLCSQNNFSSTQLFQYLDINNKDFILLNDFAKFLTKMRIPFEEKYLRKFIHNFDKDNDFCLNFQEFLGLILPKKNVDLKNKVLINKNNHYKSDIIGKNVKNIFGKLLCEELELVKNCMKTAKFCRGSRGFTSYESFVEIAGKERYITENHLYNFLQKNNININSNDMHQLMFRVDADDDGKISFNEFEEIFFPMKEGEFPYNNNLLEENNNKDYNFHTISSIKGKGTLKQIPKKIYKNNNIDFTFVQNSKNYLDIKPKKNIKENINNININEDYNNSKGILKEKKYNINYEYNTINNSSNPKHDKKNFYSKTDKTMKVYDKLSLSNINSNELNLNNIKNINNNSNNDTILTSSFNKLPTYKNNNYNFSSPFKTKILRQNSVSYKSPKIKHTKSPLYYDYSTYADEDGDEYFRKRKLRQSAKNNYDKNYLIFKNDKRKEIENKDITFENKNITFENNNINYENKNTIKPCCGCPIFDTSCPCPVNVKYVENCTCPKNIYNNYKYKSSYKNEEIKNSTNRLNSSLNSQFFKSKSQFNFLYENPNENIISERKFDEKRLYGYKNKKI